MNPQFKDDEIQVLEHLSNCFFAGDEDLDIGKVPIPDGRDRKWLNATLSRFANHDMLSVVMRGVIRLDKPKLVEILHEIENPPKPNYWNELMTWWFSSKWKVGITAFAVILPLLVQWVEMTRTVLRWVGLLGPA